MRHLVTDSVQDDPAAELEIKEDVREECGKVGTVTNVILYDKEDAGVLTVRFSDPRSAVQAVKVGTRCGFGEDALIFHILAHGWSFLRWTSSGGVYSRWQRKV